MVYKIFLYVTELHDIFGNKLQKRTKYDELSIDLIWEHRQITKTEKNVFRIESLLDQKVKYIKNYERLSYHKS